MSTCVALSMEIWNPLRTAEQTQLLFLSPVAVSGDGPVTLWAARDAAPLLSACAKEGSRCTASFTSSAKASPPGNPSSRSSCCTRCLSRPGRTNVCTEVMRKPTHGDLRVEVSSATSNAGGRSFAVASLRKALTSPWCTCSQLRQSALRLQGQYHEAICLSAADRSMANCANRLPPSHSMPWCLTGCKLLPLQKAGVCGKGKLGCRRSVT